MLYTIYPLNCLYYKYTLHTGYIPSTTLKNASTDSEVIDCRSFVATPLRTDILFNNDELTCSALLADMATDIRKGTQNYVRIREGPTTLPMPVSLSMTPPGAESSDSGTDVADQTLCENENETTMVSTIDLLHQSNKSLTGCRLGKIIKHLTKKEPI